MFQALSILALLVAIGLAVLDFLVLRPRRHAFGRAGAPVRGIERAIYLVFLVALAGMVLSSVFMLAIGDRMHRWMLILHMSLAPLFAVCIAGLALLWADFARFAPREFGGATRFDVAEKFAFWVVILASFLTILSAMLGMMTWFGSEGQETLLNLHRASALVLMIAATYQAVRLLAKKPMGA
jgi:hypothetical protein